MALCEEATVAAVDGHLPGGQTTVGMRIQLDHLQPNAVGSTVAAEAMLDKVEGRRLHFTVAVRDHRGLVACGKVTRRRGRHRPLPRQALMGLCTTWSDAREVL